jgi:hypothetical protein
MYGLMYLAVGMFPLCYMSSGEKLAPCIRGVNQYFAANEALANALHAVANHLPRSCRSRPPQTVRTYGRPINFTEPAAMIRWNPHVHWFPRTRGCRDGIDWCATTIVRCAPALHAGRSPNAAECRTTRSKKFFAHKRRSRIDNVPAASTKAVPATVGTPPAGTAERQSRRQLSSLSISSA